MTARVVILMGSLSDREHVARIASACAEFGLAVEQHVASAHKSARYLLGLLEESEMRGGPVVYITVAGRSNALSGLVDASVAAPVICCPPLSPAFGGADIFSSLRMPSGVAPLVVLEPAAAALAAAKIISLGDKALKQRIVAYQDAMTRQIVDDDRTLSRELDQ
ncbi:MAG: AIR carboxylase family protein [Chloroflexi bacterium]|nr:AIR carboxylase family protein [Chloroflexota bacterium]